jgi:hypothetical protein
MEVCRKERERTRVNVYVCERERDSVRVCVQEREREKGEDGDDTKKHCYILQ